MKIAELEKRVDLVELISEEHSLKKIGTNEYWVNPCPVCDSKDHFTVYGDTNSYSSFSHCCNGGSVYKYLTEVKGMNNGSAYEHLSEMAGVEVESMEVKEIPPTPAEVEGNNNLINSITQLYQNQKQEDKNYFLIDRGLSNSIVDEYKLSVYKGHNGVRRAVMPIFQGGKVVSYVEREIDGEKQYLNNSGAIYLFNMDHLKDKSDEPIVIVESAIDALTLEARGIKSIALNGINNWKKLKDNVVKLNAQNKLLLTAFDNDKGGRSTAEKLGYPSIQIPIEYKDINEWNVAEIEAAKKGEPIASMQNSLTAQIELGKQPDQSAHYILEQFQNDIKHMKKYKHKKTGFDNLDAELGGVFPGLNVLGSITGGGKTTFTLQLADNMARLGDHVLFFSLEQSKMELTSKSIARTTAETNLNDAVASISIRSGYQPQSVKDAIQGYSEAAHRINVIEGNFNTNAATIREYTERYIEINNVVPVVIVDYLQIMPAPDERMNDKQRMDFNVTTLKRMSRDLNITIFAISSFNRGNYMSPIDFESFKESGGIEYTADLVLGLQLEVIHDDIFNIQNKLKEKRAKITDAMKESPRQMELVCLKNRNGNARFTCSYSYWSKYDYFEQNGITVGAKSVKSESDLFSGVKTNYKDKFKKKDVGSGMFEILPN